ncbi:Nucleoside-diphosphate-sugar epimerase [Fimbriiglobus ruber]|uniref:Nucleoside-diphosphate-sugar epimerase n=1 Tax=Fimbriiglobus ruber TaxID=1908690 RepID=A0A225D5J2_9BACT|nr:Nucleoside-diphosphate-sugar epimerase [Fimbriiglobus ruber]
MAGRRVCALTRGRCDELASLGLDPITGDVLEPDSLRALPSASTVLYAVGMDRRSGRSLREVYVTGLANVLAALPPCGRFVYVSSTSVYGQTDGSLVDEHSPTIAVEESGHVILDAERVLWEALPGAVVLRFAGIYGPDRLLRKQALLKGEPLVGDADKWLNLIHVADGARAVLDAEARGTPGETYLVADGTPVRRREFYSHLARLLAAPPAAFSPAESTATTETNRRVSNRKAREELGFAPRYPSYVEGLAASV